MSQIEQYKIIIVVLLFLVCMIFIFFYYAQLSSPLQAILIIITLILFSYLIYLIVSYALLPAQFQQVGTNTVSLNKPSQVACSEVLSNAWSSKTGSTLVFYINPSINDRTAQSGNEYANIVTIGGKQSLKILIAPDAGRGILFAPAQFEVYLKDQTTPEKIDIPDFPMQKWTSVVIVKKGRRFNIYLNGKLSVSHTCTAMPDYDETAPLLVGDKRLGGSISLMSLSATALDTNEVRDLISGTVDTSGKPYTPTTFYSTLSFLIPTMPSIPTNFWCPGGNCNPPKMAGPIEQWNINYA
jgi:hypothetical protein